MTHQTMPLKTILAAYKDGDEHGWPREFEYLERNHASRLLALMKDIRKNGIQEPILLGGDGRVWDGHHRLCVAQLLGIEDIPVERGGPVEAQYPVIAAQALREYGAAIRGSWGDIDGRSVRGILDAFADEMDGTDRSGRTIDQWRNWLGICLQGRGHWDHFCDDSCNSDEGTTHG